MSVNPPGQRTLAAIALALTASINLARAEAPAAPPGPTDKEVLDNPLSKPAPKYPVNASEENIEGHVVLEIVIAPDGTVSSVKVLEAEPPGWFEQASISAVRQWRYRPPGREFTANVRLDFEIPPYMRDP